MPRQSNGALRAERDRTERARRAERDPRRVTRRARRASDEYAPTRADRRVATSASEG